ncbi:hypothetical protein ACFLVO_04415 [Chloroflexota bacterium]
MAQTKVNGIKLNKALEQFGSLDKSIKAMQKKEKEANICFAINLPFSLDERL